MEEKKAQNEINLRLIFDKVRNGKRTLLRNLAIAFVVACLIIIPVPRYYRCNILLAPEVNNSLGNGGISSLVSSFGIDIGDMAGADALYPELYPDIMESRDFQTRLFPVRVRTLEGDIDTDYYDYLKNYQALAWWGYPKRWIGSLLSVFKEKEIVYTGAGGGKGGGPNAFALTREQTRIADAIGKKVSCSIDTKTYTITISVEDQDKLICATLADTVRVMLQQFITQYRTNKARVDMEYYRGLAENAKAEYEEARRKYAEYSDANNDVVLARLATEIEERENDMQLKFNTYSTMTTQYEAARAKVQERTPAFTIVQGASIPDKPAGPKRMLFVLAVLFLTFTVTLIYMMRRELIEQFNK